MDCPRFNEIFQTVGEQDEFVLEVPIEWINTITLSPIAMRCKSSSEKFLMFLREVGWG
jgi:hypothetical protein